jgi:aspartyl-tRNA(Asn)/glutamyl-tRNA(Gln) amidotransferase subunit C
VKGPLDEQTVRHVAELARLHISDAEAELYARQLSKILDYVEQLNSVNTDGVPPTAHAGELSNVFRQDAEGRPWPPNRALSNAPKRHGDYFEVPKVLDQESA